MLPDLGGMLVPRGGIEPPTRGFSVPSSPSRRASFPLGTSVKHPARPVKAGTPKHGHARSVSRGSIVFSPDVLLVRRAAAIAQLRLGRVSRQLRQMHADTATESRV